MHLNPQAIQAIILSCSLWVGHEPQRGIRSIPLLIKEELGEVLLEKNSLTPILQRRI